MPLKNTCSVRSMGTSEKVELNLISFFDYGFLDKGGYFNVDFAQSGDYVSDISSLTKIRDNRGFTYWAGPKNWVYESAADSSGCNCPPAIKVNGAIYTSGIINYREGYVYNIPSTGTSVQAEFSYKWISMVSAKKSGYGRAIKMETMRPDLDQIPRSGAPELTITLPFVSFDVPPISTSKPYGLGSYDGAPMEYSYKAKATVVGENPDEVKRISDIIVKQQGFCLNTFNPDEATASGDYPLYIDGRLNSGKSHDQLSAQYPWGQILLEDVKATDGPNLKNGLFQSIVTMRLKMVGCGCSFD